MQWHGWLVIFLWGEWKICNQGEWMPPPSSGHGISISPKAQGGLWCKKVGMTVWKLKIYQTADFHPLKIRRSYLQTNYIGSPPGPVTFSGCNLSFRPSYCFPFLSLLPAACSVSPYVLPRASHTAASFWRESSKKAWNPDYPAAISLCTAPELILSLSGSTPGLYTG